MAGSGAAKKLQRESRSLAPANETVLNVRHRPPEKTRRKTRIVPSGSSAAVYPAPPLRNVAPIRRTRAAQPQVRSRNHPLTIFRAPENQNEGFVETPEPDETPHANRRHTTPIKQRASISCSST